MPLITGVSDRMIALELGHPIVEGTSAGGDRPPAGDRVLPGRRPRRDQPLGPSRRADRARAPAGQEASATQGAAEEGGGQARPRLERHRQEGGRQAGLRLERRQEAAASNGAARRRPRHQTARQADGASSRGRSRDATPPAARSSPPASCWSDRRSSWTRRTPTRPRPSTTAAGGGAPRPTRTCCSRRRRPWRGPAAGAERSGGRTGPGRGRRHARGGPGEPGAHAEGGRGWRRRRRRRGDPGLPGGQHLDGRRRQAVGRAPAGRLRGRRGRRDPLRGWHQLVLRPERAPVHRQGERGARPGHGRGAAGGRELPRRSPSPSSRRRVESLATTPGDPPAPTLPPIDMRVA